MNRTDNDILVLFFNNPDKKNIFLEYFDATEELQARCVFKNIGKLLCILRKIHFKCGLPGVGIWFSGWEKLIVKNKKIICIASCYSPKILKWIKKKDSTTQLINYYWDRIDISHYPIKKDETYENWTFCFQESKNYHIKYNPQFYISSMILTKQNILYDVSFVGADREGQWEERCNLVTNYYELMKKMELSIFFYFVSSSANIPIEIKSHKRMTEEKYNQIVSASKAVLEIVQPGQEWITLRPLFALTNGKKVITNNKLIVEEKYYSKENIFILGVDDVNNLNVFIGSEFKPIREDLFYYDVKEWSKRFFNKL